MPLFNDIMHASELTVFARRTQEQIEAREGSLAAFFPATTTDSDTAKYTVTDGGLVPTAEYRSFDAEASVGQTRGGRRVAMQLPPVSQKNRVGELDQIRSRAGNEIAQERVGRVTADTVTAVMGRIEAMRGTVLETGRVTIAENGFYADEDLGRDPSMTTNAGTLWDADGAKPLDDLLAWAEKYEEVNGVLPGTILASQRIISIFQRSDQVRQSIGGTAVRNVATLDEINAVLASYGLPSMTRFGRSVQIGDKKKKLLSPNKLFFLPAAGSIELGQTVFGRTAEADDPEYGLAYNAGPGVVSSVHKEWDPYAYWVLVNALALPVMTNPDASMVATVLNA